MKIIFQCSIDYKTFLIWEEKKNSKLNFEIYFLIRIFPILIKRSIARLLNFLMKNTHHFYEKILFTLFRESKINFLFKESENYLAGKEVHFKFKKNPKMYTLLTYSIIALNILHLAV